MAATITCKTLSRNQLGSTPWGNTHTFHFTLATASNGGVFDASTGDAVQSGDTLRLGVLPAGCTIGDIQVVVSTGITGLTGKLGFAYTDGADAASAPQDDAYFSDSLDLGTAARVRGDGKKAPVTLPKDAWLTLTATAAASAAGRADVLVTAIAQGVA